MAGIQRMRWPGPRKPAAGEQPFIGPVLKLTAEQMAERARKDPMPLRAPRGGEFTAERHPEVLRRQHRELMEFTSQGKGESSGLGVCAFCVILALVLGAAGWFIAPVATGMGTGLVQGAASSMAIYASVAGALVGLAAAAGIGWSLFWRTGAGVQLGGGSMWEQVYALARVTQVEYRNPAGRVVDEKAADAERFVVRRFRAWLMRMAFADRQEGIFVTSEPLLGDVFLRGNIRLETTRDLSKITHPGELYDGRTLTGRWRGVNSRSWFVSLREPIEVGRETAEYDSEETNEQWLRRQLVGNLGVWIMVVGFIVGLVVLLNVLDSGETTKPDPVDRTPPAAVEGR